MTITVYVTHVKSTFTAIRTDECVLRAEREDLVRLSLKSELLIFLSRFRELQLDAVQVTACPERYIVSRRSKKQANFVPLTLDTDFAALKRSLRVKNHVRLAIDDTSGLDFVALRSRFEDITSALGRIEDTLVMPIMGTRYQCTLCSNYDLCEKCDASHNFGSSLLHHKSHPMLRYVVPRVSSTDLSEASEPAAEPARKSGKDEVAVDCERPVLARVDVSAKHQMASDEDVCEVTEKVERVNIDDQVVKSLGLIPRSIMSSSHVNPLEISFWAESDANRTGPPALHALFWRPAHSLLVTFLVRNDQQTSLMAGDYGFEFKRGKRTQEKEVIRVPAILPSRLRTFNFMEFGLSVAKPNADTMRVRINGPDQSFVGYSQDRGELAESINTGTVCVTATVHDENTLELTISNLSYNTLDSSVVVADISNLMGYTIASSTMENVKCLAPAGAVKGLVTFDEKLAIAGTVFTVTVKSDKYAASCIVMNYQFQPPCETTGSGIIKLGLLDNAFPWVDDHELEESVPEDIKPCEIHDRDEKEEKEQEKEQEQEEEEEDKEEATLDESYDDSIFVLADVASPSLSQHEVVVPQLMRESRELSRSVQFADARDVLEIIETDQKAIGEDYDIISDDEWLP